MENQDNPIKELILELEGLKDGDKIAISRFLSRTEMFMRKLGLPQSYHTRIVNTGLSQSYRLPMGESFDDIKRKVRNILDTALEEQTRFGPKGADSEEAKIVYSKRVFLVHGQDEDMKSSVARTLMKLKLDPIILHEQPDQGRVIIEKIEAYSDVGFAVVLLSPDDKGEPLAGSLGSRPRARQNVVLELGYFIGKLGRRRTLAIYRETPNFEFPSDYHGVLYKPYDKAGKWEFEIVKELQAVGYSVSADNLIKRQNR
jgi:predicted nucleotide-binding protein